MEYNKLRETVIKQNGRPYSLNSNVYTADIIDSIESTITGCSTLRGKLWCIAHGLTQVPTCANIECDKYTRYHNKFKEGFRKFCGDPKCNVNHKETREKYRKTSLKNWGTENPLKNSDLRETCKSIVKTKYGTEHAMQSEICKAKYKKTSLKNWGTENPFSSPEVQRKCKKAMIKSIGVEYPAQDRDIMKQIMASRTHRTLAYKHTNLYYQGTYELFFLDVCESFSILDYIKNGMTFRYDYLDKVNRLYISDFYVPFRNEIIEIKSKWTYNKKGSCSILENKNLTKQKCVIEDGYNFKFLIGKAEIFKYLSKLKDEIKAYN